MKELLERFIDKPVIIYGIDNAHKIGGHKNVTIKEVRDNAMLVSASTGTQIVIPFSAVGQVQVEN